MHVLLMVCEYYTYIYISLIVYIMGEKRFTREAKKPKQTKPKTIAANPQMKPEDKIKKNK